MNSISSEENGYWSYLEKASTCRVYGKILKSVGLIFEAFLPRATLGSICRIEVGSSSEDCIHSIQAEVIGFKEKRAILMALEEPIGVHSESRIWLEDQDSKVWVGRAMLGRVVNAWGNPIDGRGPIQPSEKGRYQCLYQKPAHPLERRLIQEPVDLGIRAIDSLLTCGRGQRMGIFSGSGVGKSALLGMISRYTTEDINVIALIGERAREVREFIEKELGPEGLARSIVIVSTADESPLLRMRGAYLAACVAEYFRDEGKNVLLLMDSLTRFCMAQREVGLSLGEAPASRGYTPSVFATLPKLLERAGTSAHGGAITGLYTVLVEGDDLNDPVADSARSILDGHIVLSRKLAQRNHYPAIDILQSASRVMPALVSVNHRKWASQVREWMALYSEIEDMLHLGAYKKGSNDKFDLAINLHEKIQFFLKQDLFEKSTLAEAIEFLEKIQCQKMPQGADSVAPPTRRRVYSPYILDEQLDENL